MGTAQMNSLQALKIYFSEVLGVREILLAQDPEGEVQNISNQIIFLDEKNIRTPQGKDLLEKMIGAMKLPAIRTRILEIELGQISENLNVFETAKVVVCFSKNFSNFIQNNFPRVNLKSTFGPEALLAQPEHKREVWELLKSLIVL